MTSYWFIHTVTASTYFSLSLFFYFTLTVIQLHITFLLIHPTKMPHSCTYTLTFSIYSLICSNHFLSALFILHLTSTSSRHCPHCPLINSTLHAPIHPFTTVRHCMHSACNPIYNTMLLKIVQKNLSISVAQLPTTIPPHSIRYTSPGGDIIRVQEEWL